MIEMRRSLLTFYNFLGRIFLICAAAAAIVTAAATAVLHIFRVLVVIGGRIQTAAWRQFFMAGIC